MEQLERTLTVLFALANTKGWVDSHGSTLQGFVRKLWQQVLKESPLNSRWPLRKYPGNCTVLIRPG